jgi:putative ATPase
MEAPLAERIRPQQLEDYISQTHLIGPEGSLTTNRKGIIPSLIFWGHQVQGKQPKLLHNRNAPFFILVPLTRVKIFSN